MGEKNRKFETSRDYNNQKTQKRNHNNDTKNFVTYFICVVFARCSNDYIANYNVRWDKALNSTHTHWIPKRMFIVCMCHLLMYAVHYTMVAVSLSLCFWRFPKIQGKRHGRLSSLILYTDDRVWRFETSESDKHYPMFITHTKTTHTRGTSNEPKKKSKTLIWGKIDCFLLCIWLSGSSLTLNQIGWFDIVCYDVDWLQITNWIDIDQQDVWWSINKIKMCYVTVISLLACCPYQISKFSKKKKPYALHISVEKLNFDVFIRCWEGNRNAA